MLRRDVDEAVVAAAAHTPFEAAHRIFVLERADVMNDEAANALLKTLEEPPSYVVLLLLTDRPTQVLPTIASRCQAVRFDPPAPGSSRSGSSRSGVPPQTAEAAARLSLGDGEQGARARARRRAGAAPGGRGLARAPIKGTTGTERPWRAVLDRAARARRSAAKEEVEARARRRAPVPAQEGAQAPRDGVHRARAAGGAARGDAGARPRAPAHRPVVPRPRVRRGGRARAGLPHRPPAEALNEDAGRDEHGAAQRRSSWSTTRAPA